MIQPQTYKRLNRARDFIREAYTQGIGLEQIAAQANLSPYHFQRTYKQAFSETPHAYLTRLRLEKAKNLLRIGDLSVSEVCLEVGFESLGSFSTRFLEYVGLPPSQYRKYSKSSFFIPVMYRTIFIPACFIYMYANSATFEKQT